MIIKNNYEPLTVKVLDFNLVAKKPALLKKMRELTIYPGSGLNFELNHLLRAAKTASVKAKVITAYLKKDLVGWALLSKENSNYNFPNTYKPFNSKLGALFEIYVDPEHRRKGIGTEITKVARKHAGPVKLCICPWDNSSRSFYEKFKKYKTIKI